MRLLPTTALSLVLAAVSVGMVVPSAAMAAKEDKKADAGPKLSPSKAFMASAQEIQKLIAASDFAGAKTKIAESEATATKPDDKFYLGNFMLTVGLNLKDEGMQRKGLETMLDSGLAAPADAAKYHFFVGQFALNAKDYPGARTHLLAAAQAGYGGPSPEVFVAETYFNEAQNQITNNQFSPAGKALVAQGLPHLKKAIELQAASGAPVDPSWYNRGFKMAGFAKDPSFPEWAKLTLAKAGTTDNWRFALRGLQDDNPNMSRDENLDILRLMAASKSLQNAYSYNEYAEAAWRVGLPGEVKSVIERGRTSGEVDKTALDDLYKLATAAVPKDQASLPASEKAAAAAATGKPAAGTGNAFMSYGDYAKAATLYRLALQKGGVDADEVNTRLGIALARSGDKAGALEAFGKVNGPLRRKIADLWSVWVNAPTA
ncbi:MAG: hypothetical protein J0I80_09005 [Sphingomonas sp.]|nr:hypothetical protein [Sphingomonas sp.]